MKKNKFKKILLIFIILISMTGCTKVLKNSEGKTVQNKTTGQNLTANILCQPESKESIKLYKENGVNIKKLPKCSELSVTSGKYEGVWTTIFVKPLAWLLIRIGEIVKSYGLAVILVTLIIRTIVYPFTKSTAMQSENMKKARPELDKLEKKYKDKQDQQSMMNKSQEMMMIYKKYGIKPMAGCLFTFIQIPLFFAFYESLNRLPAIFEENFLGFQLGTTPIQGVSNGHYLYLIFTILIIAVTFFSFKLNAGASMSSEQEKQMKMMNNMMIIFISIASLSLSTGIALYWIANSGFTIIQNLIVKRKKLN